MAHSHSNSGRVLWPVLLLSVSYMLAEVVGGVLSGSLALLADAGHMATDVAAISLGIFACWIAKKPATADKTFGYYRAEILAALANGALLVAVSFWIFFEAWERLAKPAEVQGSLMTYIATGGLIVNLIALKLTHKDSKHSLNIRAVWLHVLSDALGSVSAIVAGLMVWKLGWSKADSIGSFIIGALILFNSWKLLSECVNVLLEGVPKGMDIDKIRESLLESADVEEVHDLHVWTLASNVPALSAHIGVSAGANYKEVLDRLTSTLKTQYSITHTTLQLEPEGFTHSGVDQCN